MTSCLLLLVGTAMGQVKTYNFGNLTPEEIAEFKALRHAFYQAESFGRQEAIRQQILDAGTRVDGNQNDYDVHYYGLHLDLDFDMGTIDGYVEYRIESVIDGLNAIDLNLRNELTVDSVTVAGSSATFSHTNHLIAITTPGTYSQGDEFAMTVYYHGTPYYDGAAGMMFNQQMGYAMCWTKTTPYRSRYWWPCKDYPLDKPDSLDHYIEMPSAYDIATNGVLISSTPVGGNRKLVHYKHNYPICTYNIALSCTQYQIDVQTWSHGSDSMPLYSYALPNNPVAFDSFKVVGPRALTIMSDLYGTYPFVTEKMGNADFGWYGAMEHQTCCMYSPDFHTDWVIAHETSHQWWGDMITCHTFNHIWLNEGFASYSEALYFETTLGEAAYFDYIQSQKYLGEGSIYVENLVYEEIYNSNLSYDKASWVLHMLRGVLGDSVFFAAIRDWGQSEFRYGTATTQDFISVVSTSIGADIGWFVYEWIYGEGHPDYSISWHCQPDSTGSGFNLTYLIEQTQTGGTYFEMPIKTTFTTTGGDIDTVIFNEGAAQLYSLWFADSVTNIVIDSQEWILRTVETVPFTIQIITATLPDAVVGEPYSETLTAVGGVPPYHWVFWGGDLPYGLSFDTSTATISGIPTWPADFYFTIQVSDSDTPPLANT
ncbi:MAG: M1 family metallopeptidase, partial [candidate division Zixibacteria bacterium]|nr:M1 family metallopeptidase [candidate division Zixibacteria bacterium]